jgi:hypothetical protein
MHNTRKILHNRLLIISLTLSTASLTPTFAAHNATTAIANATSLNDYQPHSTKTACPSAVPPKTTRHCGQQLTSLHSLKRTFRGTRHAFYHYRSGTWYTVLHVTKIPAEHRSTAAVAVWLFKCVTELHRVEQRKCIFLKWLVLGKGGG